MTTTMIALSTLLVIFVAVSAFLAKELVKKMGFWHDFMDRPLNTGITWEYRGDKHPGMYNIVLRLRSRKKEVYGVLIGFVLQLPLIRRRLYDTYGYVASSPDGTVIISTWLGQGACTFEFLLAVDTIDASLVEISCTDDDQELTPDVIYPPHWWQRLGFFA